MKAKVVLAVMCAFPVFCHGTGPLDPFLLRPGDSYAPCHPVSGFYPVNEKTDSFYQYKVYRSVLPPALERHAQSFDCAGQKGTLYFFAYAAAEQAQAAETFAKPVVARGPPSPLFREWSRGFVMVSFTDPPKELLAALDARLTGRSLPSTETPVPIPEPAAANFSPPAAIPSPPAVSSTTVAAPAAPVVVSTSMAASPPAVLGAPVPDLSDAVIKNLMQKIPCRGSDIPEEGKAICGFLREFRRGDTFGAVISPEQPLMGMTYGVDSDGGVSGPAYQSAVGSGRPREIGFVSLFSSTGVDDFEAQALVESRRDRRPWPKSELTERIAKHARPDRATAFPTDGRSLVIPLKGERKLFVRQSGHAWILIGVTGSAPEEQMRSEVTVAVLY